MVDNRHKGYVRHSYKELLTQRIMQISAGYEDAADCDLLRKDSVLKMCTNKSPESSDLASQPTMSRMPVVIMLMAILFNLFNASIQGGWILYLSPVDMYTTDWLSTPQFIIGTILFFTGVWY